AFALEKPEAPAQSRLGFPRDLPDAPRCGCHLRLLQPAHACRMPIGPGRFDQEAPGSTIAGLGNAAPVDPVPRGALRGHEAQIPHKLAWLLKSGERPRCLSKNSLGG